LTREQEALNRGDYLPVISLFSGAGGLDLAVEECSRGQAAGNGNRAPRVVVATDIDQEALATYQANFPCTPVLEANIRELPISDLLRAGGLERGDPVLVVGGPPCTPFSKSGFWLEEKRTSSDPDASLLDEYVRVVKEALPEAFVLENVQGLTYSVHRRQFGRLLSQLADLGYNPQARVLIAAEYGAPQLRRRVFVIGRRDGRKLRFPPPTHGGITEREDRSHPDRLPFVTAGEALGDLALGPPEEMELVEGEFAELAAEVPPGQNYLWHTDRYGGRPVFRWRSRYWTFLLRLDPNRPATTIQAQPGPWVGPFHWENVVNPEGKPRARRLRVPELLRLMTFPDSFRTLGDRRTTQRHIGNAVPPVLGKAVISSILEQLGYLEVHEPRCEGRQLTLQICRSRGGP
jgi:DNA (cytosine-5)-methyltransferase 1